MAEKFVRLIREDEVSTYDDSYTITDNGTVPCENKMMTQDLTVNVNTEQKVIIPLYSFAHLVGSSSLSIAYKDSSLDVAEYIAKYTAKGYTFYMNNISTWLSRSYSKYTCWLPMNSEWIAGINTSEATVQHVINQGNSSYGSVHAWIGTSAYVYGVEVPVADLDFLDSDWYTGGNNYGSAIICSLTMKYEQSSFRVSAIPRKTAGGLCIMPSTSCVSSASAISSASTLVLSIWDLKTE